MGKNIAYSKGDLTVDVERVFQIESRMRAHLEKLVLLMHREGRVRVLRA